MTTFVFFLVLAVYVLAGALIARHVKNSDDFYVMGERASTVLIVGTLSATYLSAVTLLGIAGIAYAEGPLVIPALGSFGAWIGTLLAVVYVGRRLKALNCRTMPEFFDKRFGSRAVTVIATLIMIVGLMGYGVIQLIGAGLVISEVLEISFPVVIILFTLALLVFCAIGGMFGVVVTDTLMFFTMLVIAAVIAPLIIGQAGFEQMKGLSASAPNYWTLGGTEERPFGWLMSQFLVWVLFFTCTPALVSRVFPAKNDFVVLRAAVIGVFFAPFMQVLVFLAAAGMRALEPGIEPADRAMIVGFTDYVPSVLGGIGLAGLMAAIMSTASTLFVLTGFALARDLYENLRAERPSERESLLVARIAQVVVALIVAVIALLQPAAIYWISIYAGAIFAVGWLPTIVAALEWRRMNSKAALGSMLAGVVTFVTLDELVGREVVALPLHVEPLMVGCAVGVAVLVGIALVTRPSALEERFFARMKETSPAQATISAILAQPDAAARLRHEYTATMGIALAFIAIAAVIWGFFFWKLGL